MLNDEIVAEVRAVREAHAAKFDYDLRAIYEDCKSSEVALLEAGFKFAPMPNPAVERTRRKRRTTHL